MNKYILGVDSGGTAFKLRAMSLEGQVLAEYEGCLLYTSSIRNRRGSRKIARTGFLRGETP